eukprot:CAMPEP_0119302972 /NCGR_PEP_ID=MMETSP1333-20130426/4487_1 /TAXON_ID=418940 /ORGANISM="Scyphosphaera apsteinii, Strain RCC1455" /LENGTH=72 /DNA_ID=CAMNT_0007305509 /DNA_START=1106 /DNA_END=1320 /DNA_ORIENTATION=-
MPGGNFTRDDLGKLGSSFDWSSCELLGAFITAQAELPRMSSAFHMRLDDWPHAVVGQPPTPEQFVTPVQQRA